MSQKPEVGDGAWLTGSTDPTALERTLAPGVALLITASLLLVCLYLFFTFVLL
jgi:hypothetical protein